VLSLPSISGSAGSVSRLHTQAFFFNNVALLKGFSGRAQAYQAQNQMLFEQTEM